MAIQSSVNKTHMTFDTESGNLSVKLKLITDIRFIGNCDHNDLTYGCRYTRLINITTDRNR